jgi:phospholipid transport system substrate-binding protein
LRPIAHGSTVAGDPDSLIKGTIGQVLEVLSDKQMSKELRQHKVIEIVAGRFEFTDMARSSLGYNSKKLSTAQQAQFVPLFTAFMEDAYLDKIDAYSGQKIQFVGQNAMVANTAEVKSVVQPADSSDQPTQINYLV